MPHEQCITVRLHRVDEPSQRAWLTMRVTPHDDPRQVAIDIDPATAVRSDATSFLHPLEPNEATVLKSDIVGGILMARKQLGKIGFAAKLLVLGGIAGDEPRVTLLPSVGYAVGAMSAVMFVLGNDTQRADLPGGFGWKIDTIEPEA